jgi:hypothetical protein
MGCQSKKHKIKSLLHVRSAKELAYVAQIVLSDTSKRDVENTVEELTHVLP